MDPHNHKGTELFLFSLRSDKDEAFMGLVIGIFHPEGTRAVSLVRIVSAHFLMPCHRCIITEVIHDLPNNVTEQHGAKPHDAPRGGRLNHRLSRSHDVQGLHGDARNGACALQESSDFRSDNHLATVCRGIVYCKPLQLKLDQVTTPRTAAMHQRSTFLGQSRFPAFLLQQVRHDLAPIFH